MLKAAGITDPTLQTAYRTCRVLHARHGRSYYLATLLLPRWKRPYVHALYGFARYADEIVDNGSPETRAQEFAAWRDRAIAGLRGDDATDAVATALRHTMRRWDIPMAHVEAFLASMAADLTVADYPTYDDLRQYMYGSAAVIGLQMLPILEPLTDEAREPARALGEAFQLTNFIRDVGEDLERGRIYLPAEDLGRFGVTRESMSAGQAGAEFKDLLRFQIARARRLYEVAAEGIPMLHPSSRPCIEAAFALYGGILRAVEEADYRVLDRRVGVGVPDRIRLVSTAWRQSRRWR
ncbi:MAG: phytoene/squalene synthase family protein [Mycobacteriaceae bacterium]|nr:phytoene/squalene synthase family protein [Mycobacteriaceae bacterium]